MQYADVRFSVESVERIWPELKAVVQRHVDEVSYPLMDDCPLLLNEEAYEALETIGALCVVTVRNLTDELVGYAAFHIANSLDRKYLRQAHEGGLFIAPAYRRGRVAIKLLEFCSQVLSESGCDMVLYSSPAGTPKFGELLSKLGYQKVDEVYARRL